ncbi:hypothetical protein DIURU_002035 [Diutina rugosa]|uniref:Uncharacterized protein n=1 Tax=Diutina rugosa TaxID=5481 RepID=A0A642URM1_DIURU|nr:uncharacterized protein DIURU_002035 [Diutina rugosa]KAA8904083.1 hypothetical protein DIURU_002035 [Diutina rugosa]
MEYPMYLGHVGSSYVKLEQTTDEQPQCVSHSDTNASETTSGGGSIRVKQEPGSPEFCFEDWLQRFEQDSLSSSELSQSPEKNVPVGSNIGATNVVSTNHVSSDFIINENGYYTYVGLPESHHPVVNDATFGTNKVANVVGASKVSKEFKRPSFGEFCESRYPWLERGDSVTPFDGNVYMWKSGEDLPLYVNDEPWVLSLDKSKLNPARVSRSVQRTTHYERSYLDAVYAYVDAEGGVVNSSLVEAGVTRPMGQVKRRRHSDKASPWEPMSIFTVFTNCKPINFKGSFVVAPHRIRQSCFGKVNMRKRRAWTRVARQRHHLE